MGRRGTRAPGYGAGYLLIVDVIAAHADPGLEVLFEHEPLGSGRRLEWRVWNRGDRPVRAERVTLDLDGGPAAVLEHGWQSWSVVRACTPLDVRPERLEAAEWARSTYSADPTRAGHVVAGDHFLLTDSGIVGFLGGVAHLGTVEVGPGRLSAVALLDGITLAPGESLELEPLWWSTGDPGAVYSEYAELWGRASGARVDGPQRPGWCSWYRYFGDVTASDIRSNLAVAAELGLELVQIDDGYQRSIGEWLEVDDRFGAPLADLAGEIRSSGRVAGVWTAPFLVAADGPVAAARPDWIVTHASGHPLRAMFNPAWGGWALALDTTNPAVLDHLREVFAALREMGFDYHKIDFCFAAAMPGRRHDAQSTRAQALRAGLQAVRDGIGDDAFLLGCGCPLGPAVGIVDAMRVSADVAPTWGAAQHWPGFEESAPAARNAVQASALRAPLHRRVFQNDPDCLLLRPDALGSKQRDVLAATVAGTGGFTVVSDDLAAYGAHERAALAEAVRLGGLGDTPLDLVDPFARPLRVTGSGLELLVDWDEPAATLSEHPE